VTDILRRFLVIFLLHIMHRCWSWMYWIHYRPKRVCSVCLDRYSSHSLVLQRKG